MENIREEEKCLFLVLVDLEKALDMILRKLIRNVLEK